MSEGGGIFQGSWLWGSVWVFYAFFYGFYFQHVANGLKPNLNLARVPGSPERLQSKAVWCRRFGVFMVLPTALETIRSTHFTSALISIAPCLFGLWVMRAVWTDVIQSKLPKASRVKPKGVEGNADR